MQDAGCRMQEAGGRRQEAGGRRQEAGGRRWDVGPRDAVPGGFKKKKIFLKLCFWTLVFQA
jgi:hypothetical protein